jgi:hypothetical protein
MTRYSANRGTSGTLLLTIARAVFDDAVVAAIVQPTLADMHAELRAAGDHPLRRARARLRGYGAFWKLVLLAPFAADNWPVRFEHAILLPERAHHATGWLVLAAVLAFTSPALTPWTGTAIIGGLIVAVLLHSWHARHPIVVVTAPDADGTRRPEINLSRIVVGGNVGGLIFMAGSMAILVAGLPSWRWFFAAAALGGVLTAAIVARWHSSHPSHGLPEHLIVLR